MAMNQKAALPLCTVHYGPGLYLAQQEARALVENYLQQHPGAELVTLPQQTPPLEALEEHLRTFSFFGEGKIVYLPHLMLAKLPAAELEGFLSQLAQNESVPVIACVETILAPFGKGSYLDAATKALVEFARKNGNAKEFLPPTESQAAQLAQSMAAGLGANLDKEAAALLTRNSGGDLFWLEQEVQKLAAAAGYGTIDLKTARAMVVPSLEEDVFKLVDAVTRNQPATAAILLQQLMQGGHNEVEVLGAVSSVFIEMNRLLAGKAAGKTAAQVFADFGVKASAWRIKNSEQRLAGYTLADTETILEKLYEADGALKSSPLPKELVLENVLLTIATKGKSGKKH